MAVWLNGGLRVFSAKLGLFSLNFFNFEKKNEKSVKKRQKST